MSHVFTIHKVGYDEFPTQGQFVNLKGSPIIIIFIYNKLQERENHQKLNRAIGQLILSEVNVPILNLICNN